MMIVWHYHWPWKQGGHLFRITQNRSTVVVSTDTSESIGINSSLKVIGELCHHCLCYRATSTVGFHCDSSCFSILNVVFPYIKTMLDRTLTTLQAQWPKLQRCTDNNIRKRSVAAMNLCNIIECAQLFQRANVYCFAGYHFSWVSKPLWDNGT